MMPPRVAVFSELPTPYRWPVYRRLLARNDLELRIFFLSRSEPDRDWDFDFSPDRRVRFLPVGTLSLSGYRSVHYHVNPGIFGVLARGRFDVVVFPGWAMFASHAGALWCRAHRRRYVVFSETHGLRPRSRVGGLPGRLVSSAVVRGASAFLAASGPATDHLVGLGAKRPAIFPFPNSPDVRGLGATAAIARREGTCVRPEGGGVVLFTGRLIRAKRVDLLVEAVSGLRRAGRPAELWIAGDGPERGDLTGRAALLPGPPVRFLGNVGYRELVGLYARADVLVLPSDHEPFGAVVAEAMACGVPAVVSDRVGAGPDLVLPGVTGARFAHGSAEALRAALSEILGSPGRAGMMGRAAAAHVSKFDHESCSASFMSAIGYALAGAGAVARRGVGSG
jgi:glycosyltransferase involved in cell wall biosynthesis